MRCLEKYDTARESAWREQLSKSHGVCQGAQIRLRQLGGTGLYRMGLEQCGEILQKDGGLLSLSRFCMSNIFLSQSYYPSVPVLLY